MALEAWLVKAKSKISRSFDSVVTSKPLPRSSKRCSSVGVLAFEVSSLMSKLFHLWQSLSDKSIIHLRNESISLEGVRKIVSNDESFLIGLACAEMVMNLKLLAKSVSRLSKRCDDSGLRRFEQLFDEFADSGQDNNRWVLSSKDMEAQNKKMDRYVTVTITLYKEMEELTVLENSLRRSSQCRSLESTIKEQKITDLQQKILWQRQEVMYLKERSLWDRSFDGVVTLLSKSIFTVLARIKLVYGIGHGYPPFLPRSLSPSATVHPTDNPSTILSGPLKRSKLEGTIDSDNGFFDSNSKLLKPPPTTLGAAALAIHYANLILVMEKLIKSPQLVGVDARDDLYSILPRSVRSSLRCRLKGVGFSASDPVLAGEWGVALGRILGWLSPLAHNMIKWQSERNFEQRQHQNLDPKTNILLLQTLFFANKEKTEAAITELLVGLNYLWRYEREMTAKALFECANFNGVLGSAKCF
ncbi:hypothetical protein K2173_008705 [Erythroxylum novogranatense]|uniref:Uncharacterized protein n=1 Tax=Erythroxylum novogranatense TaxID=1862640 RepID=A0AAV8SM31_9ROSI|nr:hypothetical protein K2173_008705 [Erythroxylum novogranatense]